MNPDASMKTRKQAFIVSKIHWWRHQVSQVRAVEIIDLRISYQKGEPIAYIPPITTHGRHWLWDHVKYPYVGSNAIVDAEQLLALLQRMEADELTIHWQSCCIISEPKL